MAIKFENGFRDEEGKIVESLKAEGHPLDFVGDICKLTEIIYRKLKNKREESAFLFKTALIMAFGEGKMFMTEEEQRQALAKEGMTEEEINSFFGEAETIKSECIEVEKEGEESVS